MISNKLFYGDNLRILRDEAKIASETVDLCYIDPPFNSKRNYFQIYNNHGSEDLAQAQAFEDTWNWGEESIDGMAFVLDIKNLQSGRLTYQTVELIRGLHKVLGEGDLLAYLIHITLRVVEIHRVLKSTGSFYLHCDPTASHYLKLIVDSVFVGGGGDFINEIVWSYQTGGASKTRYARKHDVILFYAKSTTFTFNSDAVREPRTEKSLKRAANPKGARIDATNVDKLPTDVFSIQALNPMARERLGYPTQKPEALLERLILASSNEGDVVLDAYCGCGTTVAVAQRLGRRWIGIDITYQSIALILKRLKDRYPSQWAAIESNLYLDGVPKDIDSARALAHRKDDKTRKEFEKWSILTYSDNQARINPKKGADGGIDGVAYFMIDADKNGKAVLQSKSGKVSRRDIATLNSDRLREGAEFGILITLEPPSKPMIDEAKAVGKYAHPSLRRSDDRIQIVTIEQMLAGEAISLPMARRDSVKSAEAIALDPTSIPLFDESPEN